MKQYKNKPPIAKIGVYGGTFDPIHLGHLVLAAQILEEKRLDQILFVVAEQNPLKEDEPAAAMDHRMEMVRLAIEPFHQFALFEAPGVIYTIDLIKKVRAAFPSCNQFFLILGDDQLFEFDQWKDVAEIIKLAPPLIGRRREIPFSIPPHFSQELQEKIKEGAVATSLCDIASTRIRKRIRAHLGISHLVPLKVVDYIYQNNLYCN